MIEPSKAYTQQNEFEHRDEVERELIQKHDKRADVIIPYGKKLGFTGLNGEQVTLILNADGAFTIDAGTGIVRFAGDLEVTGSVTVGEVRWPVALQPAYLYAADGATIEWADGAALSQIPLYTITVPSGVALAAGEAWEAPTIQNATTTGGTLRLKISTPGATSTTTDNTDSAGGAGEPNRVMHKSVSADAYNGIYTFTFSGTIDIESEPMGGGSYYHDGAVTLSTWFNDGGGWDEGPTVVLTAANVLGYSFSTANLTGNRAFTNVSKTVTWANAVGQHGGTEFGASYESGGSLTDLVSVAYTTQSTSGVRTGSPNGETATIIVTPQNSA